MFGSIIRTPVKACRAGLLRRSFSEPASRNINPYHRTEVSSTVRNKNAILAVTLLGFVGGIYYVAISKMRQGGDELNAVIELEESDRNITKKSE